MSAIEQGAQVFGFGARAGTEEGVDLVQEQRGRFGSLGHAPDDVGRRHESAVHGPGHKAGQDFERAGLPAGGLGAQQGEARGGLERLDQVAMAHPEGDRYGCGWGGPGDVVGKLLVHAVEEARQLLPIGLGWKRPGAGVAGLPGCRRGCWCGGVLGGAAGLAEPAQVGRVGFSGHVRRAFRGC